ncbi:hypothetical protein OIU76_001734 [Salix suchowensis]|nr:hypothetical protein OIU76_001734 [Salix suchowensis]
MGKVVIVATNMLESMIVHPTLTRAKVSDIAIAVLEGADAVMLYGETHTESKFPLKVVKVMHTVSLRTQATIAGSEMPPNLGQAFKWGCISSKEFDEAMRLEEALFGEIPEETLQQRPLRQQGVPDKSKGLNQQLPLPSPSHVAQQLLKQQIVFLLIDVFILLNIEWEEKMLL